MNGVRLYCDRHRTVETATPVAAEALIYALSAALTDEETCPKDVHHGEDSIERLALFCPIEALGCYSDPEAYGEHITAMTDARRAADGSEQEAGR